MEQDEFIGTRFGEGGHLEVIMVSGKKRSNKVYGILCHICKNDPELFGDGIFHRVKADLVAGNIPCGCSKRVIWSKEQYEVLAKREAKECNYIFKGFTGDWKGKWTSIAMQCDRGHDIIMSLNNFLFGYKCKSCGIERTAEASRKSDEEQIASFMKTGKFLDGTFFMKSRRKSSSGDASYWVYYCPKCSEDDYVKAGVCNGMFESHSGCLQSGIQSCRCGKYSRKSKDVRKYEILKRIDNENLPYEFVGFVGDGYGIHDKITIKCDHHGCYDISISGFLHSKSRCSACGMTGFAQQRDGTVYVMKVSGISGEFTGYGITNNIKQRMSCHKRNLKDNGFMIEDHFTIKTSGRTALSIETSLKQAFPIHSQQVVGFAKEATYYDNYYKVIEFIQNKLKENK